MDVDTSALLIVDDDMGIRQLMSTFLGGKGFKVLLASNSKEAEKICRSHRPDLAVLDYSLPDGNALDLIQRLKAIELSMGIVVLTGYGTIELAVEAIKLGADQFLTK